MNIKNESGDTSGDISMEALDCNFHVEVASYHISWGSYCTAKHHAEYHAKDLKQKEPLVNDFQTIETDFKKKEKQTAWVSNN